MGSSKVALKGETATDEMSGYPCSAWRKNSPSSPWLRCLAVLGPRYVKTEKIELTLPEQGRDEELSKFAKVCKLD